MSRNWYLVHAKARQESVAEMNLQQQQVETFFPRTQQFPVDQCKSRAIGNDPLFPGYLFVKLDISTEFRKVTYSHGVIGLVKFGSTPAIVENAIIETIKARGQGSSALLVSPSHPGLKQGQPVLIDKGPFSGFEAFFDQELNGLQRVALLLKTVAFQGRLVIDQDHLSI